MKKARLSDELLLGQTDERRVWLLSLRKLFVKVSNAEKSACRINLYYILRNCKHSFRCHSFSI